MNRWLILIYSVPRRPSASRVYVWRKLKRMGAEPLQDAAWVLPASPRNEEHLRWLAAEIEDLRGTALLWNAELAEDDRNRALIRRFEKPVQSEYRRLLRRLAAARPDRAELARRYREIHARDHFEHPLGREVRRKLTGETEGKET